MVRNFLLLLSISILAAFTGNPTSDLLNCAAFKITVLSNGLEMEWEFENPDEFEFEVGNKVMKGNKAKAEVEKMFHTLQLTKTTKVEEIKQVLEKQGFNNIDKFVVRLKQIDEELLTWSWVDSN
ncbi:hypothetical protein ACNQFZ_15515 [Schinkia sp. CFF1]